MSPLVLILVSIVAISILVAVNFWLGGWKPSRVSSLEAAIQRLREDYLAFETGTGVLTADKRAALIAEQAGNRTGLVIAQGDILVSRLVAPADIASAKQDGKRLRIAFHDFTLPSIQLEFEDDDAAREWMDRLTMQERQHA